MRLTFGFHQQNKPAHLPAVWLARSFLQKPALMPDLYAIHIIPLRHCVRRRQGPLLGVTGRSRPCSASTSCLMRSENRCDSGPNYDSGSYLLGGPPCSTAISSGGCGRGLTGSRGVLYVHTPAVCLLSWHT